MRFMLHIAAMIAIAPIQEPGQDQRWTWHIGEEREVDEGAYVRLVEELGGWRIWRVEFKTGVQCRASRGIAGSLGPVPGPGALFISPEPYAFSMVSKNGRVSHFLEGRWRGGRAEYRLKGQRFWTEFVFSTDLTALDGEQVDVHVDSWRYPAIRVGHADQRGTVDFAGYKAALAAALKCATK